MVFVVILTFAVSWLPLYIIFIVIKFEYLQYDNVRSVLDVMLPIAQWLGASNSCINPILFAYMNRSFRIHLMVGIVMHFSRLICFLFNFFYRKYLPKCSGHNGTLMKMKLIFEILAAKVIIKRKDLFHQSMVTKQHRREYIIVRIC